MISVSAPCKVHLLGEHAVVYGKPAILTAVNLRITATISKSNSPTFNELTSQVKKVIEGVVKKHFRIKRLPLYQIEISSEAPIGAGLGSSAAVSSAYIAALLSFLKIDWDLNLVNELAYETEKLFHGNPSGADNSTVVYGGLVWYRKEDPNLKIIHPLPFSIPNKLAKNFIMINTGKPKQTTREMVEAVKKLLDKKVKVANHFLESQEKLVRQLLTVISNGNEKELIRIIREGEANLESIGVCSTEVKKIIRHIEAAGGAAKICGAGASEGPTGVLLCYHPQPSVIQKIAKSYKLNFFKTNLGVEGLKIK